MYLTSLLNNIFRIAATFDSPRLQGDVPALYRLFKTSQTLETGSITSRLIINQSGRSIFVEKESANLYIPDHARELKIYLTNDEVEQECCFNTKLPHRLAQWIMSEPDRPSFDHPPLQMVAAVQSVLSVSRRALSKVLNEHGMVSIDVQDEPETISVPYRLLQQETLSTVTTEIASHSLRRGSESVSTHNYEVFSERLPQISGTTTIRRGNSPLHVSERVSTISNLGFEELGPSRNSCMQLLSHVTEAAHRTTFPMHTRSPNGSLSDLDSVQESNYPRDSFNLRQYPKLERDKRVGAAGELFVSNPMRLFVEPHDNHFERSLNFFYSCCLILTRITGGATFVTMSMSTPITLISKAGTAEKQAILFIKILRVC